MIWFQENCCEALDRGHCCALKFELKTDKQSAHWTMGIIAIIIFLLAITFNALANILMKASAVNEEKGASLIQAIILNPWFIGGLACFGMALVFYRYVLGQGIKLSVAYPIMTTGGFAIVLLASKFFFHENLNMIQYAGIGLLVIGIWMIASQMS